MKRSLILIVVLLPVMLICLSCGGSTPTNTQVSGLKYRAFVSGISAGASAPGLSIVNAENDTHPTLSPISAGANPQIMVLTPNRAQTVVFSGTGTADSDNQLSLINNDSESNAVHVALPGMTYSIVISPDSSTIYVALPTASVVGQSPGEVEAISLASGGVIGVAAVPAVRYLSLDNGGDRIFGFMDNSDAIAIITPSQIGIGNAVTTFGGQGVFDRPVQAFFSSDDATAFVVSCGAECGGTQAGVQQIDMTTSPPSVVRSIPSCIPTPGSNQPQCATQYSAAGSFALVNGSTMYLVGTPYAPVGAAAPGPSQLCAAGTTQATYCGLLTIIDLGTLTVANTAPIIITDGYHNRLALGSNGQLFIGAAGCAEIYAPEPPVPPGSEVRGCLSIYNTLSAAVGTVAAGGVVVPPQNGDATGIQPITDRQVTYVAQGGSLRIYDDTIDALYYNPSDSKNPGQIFGLLGDFTDVLLVDF